MGALPDAVMEGPFGSEFLLSCTLQSHLQDRNAVSCF